MPYIAEFALRRQWGSLTEDERQRFVAAFQRLSVMTYAARFGNVAPDAFRPIEAGAPDANGRVQVTTAIKREGQPDVSLEYLLQQDGEDWKIINIVADGVSDLALKRAEYQRVFARGSPMFARVLAAAGRRATGRSSTSSPTASAISR